MDLSKVDWADEYRKKIKNFDEFFYQGHNITTELELAEFDSEKGVITIPGSAEREGFSEDVYVVLEPEDTPEFNVSVSASEGSLTTSDLEFVASVVNVQTVEDERLL
jgi:hypothetical protein